jgi:hypothetical protein
MGSQLHVFHLLNHMDANPFITAEQIPDSNNQDLIHGT